MVTTVLASEVTRIEIAKKGAIVAVIHIAIDHCVLIVGSAQRNSLKKTRYRYGIGEFVDWRRSEPRLSFNKTVVARYRMHPESRHLALA
jgi:hypothetical protein